MFCEDCEPFLATARTVGGGRWLSEDPIGFAGGDANLARYVGNSPGNLTDPTGQVGGASIPGSATATGKPGNTWNPHDPAWGGKPKWWGPFANNPQARADLLELVDFVRGLPADVPLLDPCFNWAGQVLDQLPLRFERLYRGPDKSLVTVRPVYWDVIGSRIATEHVAFEVMFPDGSVVYFDEGGLWSTFAGALGGPGRWFGPDAVPPNYINCRYDL